MYAIQVVNLLKQIQKNNVKLDLLKSDSTDKFRKISGSVKYQKRFLLLKKEMPKDILWLFVTFTRLQVIKNYISQLI